MLRGHKRGRERTKATKISLSKQNNSNSNGSDTSAKRHSQVTAAAPGLQPHAYRRFGSRPSLPSPSAPGGRPWPLWVVGSS